MRRLLLLLPLTLGAGCKACFKPGIPNPPNPHTGGDDSDDSAETGDSKHTGDSTPPVDTTPEPPCDVPEVEGETIVDPQELPLEEWACGDFDNMADYEWFGFTIDQADWVRLSVHAASIGSAADISLLVNDVDDGSYYAFVTGSSDSPDPYLVFHTDKARGFLITMGESYYGYGDDYTWEMMAGITKPPVTWTGLEVEPNDTLDEATAIVEGDVLYGTIGSASDFDRFKVTIPDDSKRDVKVTVVAYNQGSPADLRAVAYDPEGNFVKASSSGDSVYDRDPQLTFTTDQAGDYTVLLREEYDKGSPLYWYVISVDVSDPAEADTSGTDSGS